MYAPVKAGAIRTADAINIWAWDAHSGSLTAVTVSVQQALLVQSDTADATNMRRHDAYFES